MTFLLPPFLTDTIFNGADLAVLLVAAVVVLFLALPRRTKP